MKKYQIGAMGGRRLQFAVDQTECASSMRLINTIASYVKPSKACYSQWRLGLLYRGPACPPWYFALPHFQGDELGKCMGEVLRVDEMLAICSLLCVLARSLRTFFLLLLFFATRKSPF